MRLVYQFLINAALLSVLLTGVNNLQAQNSYGDNWVLGSPPAKAEATNGSLSNRVMCTTDTLEIGISNACISDANGNLQFFSNGVNLYNSHCQIIKNGADINNLAGTSWETLKYDQTVQGTLIIPQPDSKSLYWVFHFFALDTSGTIGGYSGPLAMRLRLTIVDMQGDSGRGEVISKEVILENTPMASSKLTACKHANGRDWWIVKTGAPDSNLYYKFLLSPDGLSGPFIQSVGPKLTTNFSSSGASYGGTSAFSNDGAKFAVASTSGPIVVMDFNRCTGEFGRYFTLLNRYDAAPSFYGVAALAFSPSGRFLYVTTLYSLNQYDLDASPTDSVRLLTLPNEAIDPGNWLIFIPQLAPNGKIYISTYNGGIPGYHVIHYPDRLGTNCIFVPFGQPVNTINAMSIPNMPNYRLGKLVGSPCDTLVSDIKYTEALSTGISVYPNPAANTINISIAENQPGLKLFVTDINGSIVHSQAIYSETAVDISKWAAGFYFVRIESNSKLMAMRKFVKE
ncbi:MAG: hypothetical protein BGO32_09475 [Bacteroidetes bacterium 37-13]|nr:MAG: hypothetical protein BGO32_09475 [Bacteroidetes bacterium 37-13]